MIFYDEDVSLADQPEEQSSSSGSALTYEDIYNAVYNGYMDAYTEIQIEQAEKEELEEETTPQEVQRVYVDNFPSIQTVKVNNLSSIDYSSITDAIEDSENNTSSVDVVEFASDTDSKLYTATVERSPVSTGEQTVAYILDIRNILLLFLLVWFAIYLINMIKKSVIKFMKGKNDNE